MPVRSLAEILGFLFSSSDLNVLKASRVTQMRRARLADLMAGAQPTRGELQALVVIGVPLDACTEWLALERQTPPRP